MREGRRQVRFTTKARRRVRNHRAAGTQDLDRHDALRVQIHTAVDDGRATDADAREDTVAVREGHLPRERRTWRRVIGHADIHLRVTGIACGAGNRAGAHDTTVAASAPGENKRHRDDHRVEREELQAFQPGGLPVQAHQGVDEGDQTQHDQLERPEDEREDQM